MGFAFDIPKKIEICGKEYECDPSNPDIMLGAAKNFQEIVSLSHKMKTLQISGAAPEDKAKAATEEAIRTNLELLEVCRRMIEGCLGTEEYQEIFRGRRPNSTEHLNLCTYLFEYLTAGRDEVVKEYLDLPEGAKDHAADTAAQDDPGTEDRDGVPEVVTLCCDARFSTPSRGEVHLVPAEHSGGDTAG